jgi:hypothetical protein
MNWRRRTMKPKILLLLFVAAALAAAPSLIHGEEEFKVVMERGIPVAVNPANPVPASNSPRDIRFEEELTLGATEGDPHFIFGDFIRFAADDEGNIYVLDRESRSVKKFSPSGDFLGQFGRPGQGPGEFQLPEEIRLLADGNLIVFDGEGQRFSVFHADGSVVESRRFLKLMFPPYFGFSSANFIASHILFGTKTMTTTTGLYDENCELIAALHRSKSQLPAARGSPNDQEARAKRLAESFSRAAFRQAPVIALNRDEDIFFGFSGTYEIQIRTAKAELKRIIRTALPLLPVTQEDRRDYIEIWVPKDLSTWSTMSGQMKKKITSQIRFPDKKPAFLQIIPMDGNFLMVLRDGWFNRNALIDIFDPQGRFIIEKKLPFPIKAGLCRDGRLHTLFEDVNGNQFVRRYAYKLY